MGSGTEGAIAQTERAKDIPITREQFVEAKASNFLKFEEGKDYLIGISEAKYALRDFGDGDGAKPNLILVVDFLNGVELEEPFEFSTQSKLLANSIEEYRKNESVNLLRWIFKMQRTGAKMQTKYSLTPVSPRPKA